VLTRALRLVVAAALMAGIGVLMSEPALACSCAQGRVAQSIGSADSVYVGRARAFDLVPGASFRVDRVLKGPARSNLRVKVFRGECGTSTSTQPYVITGGADGSIHALSACREHLRGSAAVWEAERILGPGVSVPWRPDPAYVAQWFALGGLAGVALVIARKRRGHREALEGRGPWVGGGLAES
jgi:hypothetical protein